MTTARTPAQRAMDLQMAQGEAYDARKAIEVATEFRHRVTAEMRRRLAACEARVVEIEASVAVPAAAPARTGVCSQCGDRSDRMTPRGEMCDECAAE
jgi:uncharacterized protein YqfA (UPF0365 family)